MANDCTPTEEHELPSVEALLACTLVLMTGYSQALQADVHPRQRLAMGEKIAINLVVLVDHPLLSMGFRQILLGLQQRWRAMGACTRDAADAAVDDAVDDFALAPAQGQACRRAGAPSARHRPAPKRLH